MVEPLREVSWGWVHACEGHFEAFEGGPYRTSDRPEDQGVAPREDA